MPSRAHAISTRLSSGPRRRGGSSTGCTATKFRPLLGAHSPTETVGRARSECRRAFDRRTRAGSYGFCRGQLLGPSGDLRSFLGRIVPGDAHLRRRPQGAEQPGFRSRHRTIEGRFDAAPQRAAGHGTARANPQRRLPSPECRRQALRHSALSAVHHQHSAAGGEPQVRAHRSGHDAGGSEPLRDGHITYMRTDSTIWPAGRRSGTQPGSRRNTARKYLRPTPAIRPSQERSRSPRTIRPAGHPFDFPERLRASLTTTSSDSTT